MMDETPGIIMSARPDIGPGAGPATASSFSYLSGYINLG